MNEPDGRSPDGSEELRRRLEEAEDTIRAIRLGEVDAFVMLSAERDQVFTLEEVEKPFRLFVERMHQAAATLSADGSIFYCNRPFSEMVHQSPESLLGAPFRNFVDRSFVPSWDAMCRDAGELGSSQGEIALRVADAGTVPVYASVAGSGRGRVALSVILTDLTDQKRSEAIVTAESLSSSILDQAADAIVVCDENGTVIRASRGVSELCGRNPMKISFDSLFPPEAFEGLEPISVRAMLQSEEVREAETKLRRADGRAQDLHVRVAPLRRAGRVVGCVVTLTDISERKRVELALREADRRKDQFLAVLGHELRNAVGPIRNSARILEIVGDERPASRQARVVIERQIGHMTRLIDDLLDVSRIAEGKILLRKQSVDFRDLLQAAADQYRGALETNGLSFEVRMPDQPLWVSADATRLAQVLQNVLQNAAKFTDPGGRVTVEASGGPGGTLELRIRDTGIGMDEETVARVFDFFSQGSTDRSREGLGLGMALSRGLVRLHGGEMTARSGGSGQGSEFTIRLPLGQAPGTVEPAPPPSPAIRRAFRILIIEDNVDMAESMKMLLELTGHQVETANTGRAGVEIARAFRPEVVLCDIGLPGGMNGHAVARALRNESETASAYLIAVSGYAADEDQRRALKSGFDLHVSKPIRLDDLEQALAGLPIRKAGPETAKPSGRKRRVTRPRTSG